MMVCSLCLALTLAGARAQDLGDWRSEGDAEHARVSNLPGLWVVTADGLGVSSKTEYKLCTVWLTDTADVTVRFDSVSIRGRGNSTWGMAKKPFRIKFAKKEKLLGRGRAKAKKWNLLANAADKTMMRNAVTSRLGALLGQRFVPAAEFCDMWMNGNYVGTYQLTDAVEVRPHRVDITEQEVPVTDSTDISGGYLLECDGFRDGNCFTSSAGLPVRIHYPDEEDIALGQTAYIKKFVNAFEKVLFGAGFADPETGYRRWVDAGSLASWFVATEVSANIDGYYSTYFYKDRGDSTLYFGPLWDYDIAYDNDTRIAGNERRLMTDVGYGDMKTWMNRMWEDEWFCRLVADHYAAAVSAGLEEKLLATVDSLSALLAASQALNYKKWGIARRVYHERVLYSSFSQYVDDLRTFITAHIAYLSEVFSQRRPLDPTPPLEPDTLCYRVLNAGNGHALTLAASDSVSVGCDAPDESDPAQLWEVRRVADRYMLVNLARRLALTDPTEGAPTATTLVGTRLTVSAPDSADTRQLWAVTPQGTDGRYSLTNLYTDHTANLSGGSSAADAPVLSYTHDARDATSANRLWTFTLTDVRVPRDTTARDTTATDTVPDVEPDVEPDFIRRDLAPDYALVSDGRTLRFAADDPAALRLEATVTDTRGRRVGTFRSGELYDMSALPRGLYVVTWAEQGRLRSVKVVR